MSNTESLNAYVFGAPPPNHTDLESAILGAILSHKDGTQICLDVFGAANPFYLTAHRIIYETAKRLYDRYDPVDILTVQTELKKAGHLDAVGGPYFLVELTNKIASTANTEYHCRIVYQAYIQREISRVSGELMQMANDPRTDALELLEKAEQSMFTFSSGLVINTYQEARRVAVDLLKESENIRSGKALPGIATGFHDLDNYFHALVPGEIYVFAGRPGMGKTALVLSMGKRIAEQGKKVGIFSLEMSKAQLMQRLISQLGGLDLQDVMNPKRLDEVRFRFFVQAIETASSLPLLIDDTGGLSIFQLKGKARAMRREGCEVIIIDYLQLMNAGGGFRGNRNEELGEIMRGLKALAKELGVPIILLSQLSREAEKRADKRPQMSDLRESGNIEQDAYVIAMVYRPEYYGFNQTESGESTRGIALIIVAKNRNGATGDLFLRFKKETTEFIDYSTQVIPAMLHNDTTDVPF